MSKHRVYISGPMTGLPENNFPAFFEAEKELKKQGKYPINPARNPDGLEYHHYMDISLAMVRCADSVCLLPGWENSSGAVVEVAYARSLGKEIKSRDEILNEI